MVANVLEGTITIQEKIDGSQFSFGLIDGILKARSKNRELNLDVPDAMFQKGIDLAKNLHARGVLGDGCMFTGEILNKPRHNTLEYERTPHNNVIIFDIRYGHEAYYYPAEVIEICGPLGLETVPVYYHGPAEDMPVLTDLMNQKSILGGTNNIEGIVIKNYEQFCKDGTVQMSKVVSEAFKEKHSKHYKDMAPSAGDIIQRLKDTYRSPARWQKAFQHLSEDNRLRGIPADIGPLIKETQRDILAECGEEMCDILLKWAWNQIKRNVVGGLPEWYLEKLEENDDANL